MGEIFLAEDEILHRRVALKFLHRARAAELEPRERLSREARSLATLAHPNIATIHALESQGDRLCLVMEFIEGETLAERIARRPLPIGEVVSLGLALSEALTHAHGRGIVHRDVKPGNILVTPDGRIKLTDFGIALLQGATTLTAENMLPGTVAYMSPEQTLGEPTDGRSDLFSMGIVLYEALTGSRPFYGERIEALVHAIRHQEPEPPTARRSGIPLELERIVLKCLEKDAALRYQHAEDLAADLKRMERGIEPASASPNWAVERRRSSSARTLPERPKIQPISRAVRAGAAGLIVLALGAWALGQRFLTAKLDPHTVLIFPMEIRGQVEGSEYVGRAFAEALAVNLARAQTLSILPIAEAGSATRQEMHDRLRIARKMRAGRLVTGALTRSGQTIRASLSLTDVAKNRIKWGGDLDAEDGSLPLLATSLASQLADEMSVERPKLYESPYHLMGTPEMTAKPEFAEVLGALRRQSPEEGLEASRRLVEAFPDEPEAHVLHVMALVGKAFFSSPTSLERTALEAGVDNLERVDPGNPWADVSRAIVMAVNDQPDKAVSRLTRALARNDLTAGARGLIQGWRGDGYLDVGNVSTALADLEEAVRLDPTNDNSVCVLARALRGLGRPEEAVNRARQAVALNPSHPYYKGELSLGLVRAGMWERALPYLKEWYETADFPEWVSPIYEAARAVVLLRAGRILEAGAAAKKAASVAEPGPSGCYVLACYRLENGERAAAKSLLKRAIELGYQDAGLAGDPNLAPLLADPDFQAMAVQMQEHIRSDVGGVRAPR